MSSDIIIIGAGGHAVSVANIAFSNGQSIIGFVDDKTSDSTLLDIPIINKDACRRLYPSAAYVIAIGDNAIRKKVAAEFKQQQPQAQFPALIHKSASIGFKSKIGQGSVIMAQANIGPNSTIGEFCIINTQSSLDHDSSIGNFGSLAPGVITGGNVQIGHCSAISIGATIKHGVKIGTDSIIGASSYVNTDIDDRVVAYGVPSKIIRSRQHGDPYLI